MQRLEIGEEYVESNNSIRCGCTETRHSVATI